MNENEIQTLSVDLVDAFKEALNATNRASYFSIVAAEAASKIKDITSWSISSKSDILTFHQPSPNQSLQKEIESYFPIWVLRNLVRDVVESFFYCLPNVYFYTLLSIKQKEGGKIPGSYLEEAKRESRAFGELKISEMNQKLKRLGIIIDKANHQRIFEGLKDIRNCLSHNQGIITQRFGKSGSKNTRIFDWLVFEIGVVNDKGKKRKITKPTRVGGTQSTYMRLKKIKNSYCVGDHLSFSQKEVFEIAHTIKILIDDTNQQIMALSQNY